MKFIADEMLGRLAKWMRTIGYDTLYVKPADDSYLIKQALKEERIILTRDTRLVSRKHMPRFVLIKSDDYKEQLKEVKDALALKMEPENWFKRCIICNAETEPVEKESIKDKVHKYTYDTHENFYQCPGCKRVYWAGTHIESVRERLKAVVGNR